MPTGSTPSGGQRRRNGNWPKPLLAMVAASHSPKVMKQVRNYEPDGKAWDIFKKMSQGMLTLVRPEGSSCVLMSALLAVSLEEPLGTVVPVVADALKVGGDYMYGSDRGFDGSRVFSAEGDDWDGHCWLLFGHHIVDVSPGRTARLGPGKQLFLEGSFTGTVKKLLPDTARAVSGRSISACSICRCANRLGREANACTRSRRSPKRSGR